MSWRKKLLWNLNVGPKDYREFFDKYTTRKPVTWDEIRGYDYPRYIFRILNFPGN